MKFVKRIDESHIEQCPKQGVSHGRVHTHLPRFYAKNPDLAAEDGYFELVEQDKPEGWYEPRYTADGMKIYQSWVPYTPPEPEPDPLTAQVEQNTEDIEALTEAVLEMSEEVYA